MNGFNFTERVRKILAMARDEAGRLQNDYVAPEHMLLALLREGEGVGAAVLRNLGADVDAVSATVEGLIGPPKRAHTSTGPDLPYTQRGKRALEFAMAEARELSHPYVGSEHLLLALLRDETTIAARALTASGVTSDAARTETLRLLGDPTARPSIHDPRGTRPTIVPAAAKRRAAVRGTEQIDEHAAWIRLTRALEVSERLGTPPAVTLEADGTLTVPLGPDLLITVEFPAGLRLRRRDEPLLPEPTSPQESA